MLYPKSERGIVRWNGRCPDCDGCINDRCGGCNVRFCGGTYAWMQWDADVPEDKACDRCPEKVDWVVVDEKGRDHFVRVRCNGTVGHTGGCNPNPSLVGY